MIIKILPGGCKTPPFQLEIKDSPYSHSFKDYFLSRYCLEKITHEGQESYAQGIRRIIESEAGKSILKEGLFFNKIKRGSFEGKPFPLPIKIDGSNF